MAMQTALDPMKYAIALCVWHTEAGWVWDDSEDHGGFDRCVPMGPFNTEEAAMLDGKNTFPDNPVSFRRSKPDHYEDRPAIGASQ